MPRRKKKLRPPEQVCLYARYSTNNQTELSIQYQIDESTEYCNKMGYTIVATYYDEAQTGTNDNRAQFNAMIAEAQNEPPWSKIIVFSFSRFARNNEEIGYYRYILRHQGITVESATEINADTPEAQLMRDMAFSFDAYPPEKCAAHTHAALKTMAKRGEHCGGTPPLGYNIEDKKLVINEYEAETVRLIFDMYSKNYSYADMMKHLEAEGRMTKKGTPFKKTSFNSLLRQEKYIGTFVWNRATAKDVDGIRNNQESKPIEEQVRLVDGCPAIVDSDVFEKVQQRLNDNRNGNTRETGKRHYMLGGMQKIQCAECGAYMVGASYKSHNKSKRYYVCPNHRNGGCHTKNIQARYVEHFIAYKAVNILLNKQNYTKYNELIKDNTNKKTCVGITKELNTVNRSISNLISSLEKRPTDDLLKRLEELDAQKQLLQNKINSITVPVQIDNTNLKEVRQALVDEFKKSVDPLVHDVIDAMIEKITVDNDGLDVCFNM